MIVEHQLGIFVLLNENWNVMNWIQTERWNI